jgi:hypothetical protein
MIAEGIKIIKDGEPMRTLGTWVGNNADILQQWDWIMKKQEKVLKTWEGNHLSYQGKELILKALVQSRAMFMTTINGMPKSIEIKMTKMYKDFLWDNKPKGLMTWKQVAAVRKVGGLNVPNVKSRVQAIQLMWFKRWTSMTNILIETPRKVCEQRLELTPRRKGESAASEDKTIFDPEIEAKGTPLKETRIFLGIPGPKTRCKVRTKLTTTNREPAYRKEPINDPPEQKVTIATRTYKPTYDSVTLTLLACDK